MGIFNATSTYGQGFISTNNLNEFFIKIYTGGFAGPKTAEKRLIKEIDKFLINNDYTSYKILSRKFNWIPSYYNFFVVFEK